MVATSSSDTTRNPLIHAGHTIWGNVPILMVLGIVVAVAAIPGLIVASSGVSQIALPLLVLSIGATWAGCVATAHRLLADEPVTIPQLFGMLRRSASPGFRVSLVPAFVVASLFGIMQMFNNAESGTWLLGPLAIDTVVLILVALTLPMVYSIAIERRTVDREVWLDALTLAGRSPLQAIGSLTLVGIVGVTVFSLAPALLPVLAGPTAILFCTVFNEAMGRRRG